MRIRPSGELATKSRLGEECAHTWMESDLRAATTARESSVICGGRKQVDRGEGACAGEAVMSS